MSGGDFPEPALLIRTAAEAGRVRQTVHPFRLNGRGLAGFLIAWLFLPVVVFLIALAAGARRLVPALYILVIAAAGLAYPFAAVVGARIGICEYGLIVSTLPGNRMRFFIPYSAIDRAASWRTGAAARWRDRTSPSRRRTRPTRGRRYDASSSPRARGDAGRVRSALRPATSTSGARPLQQAHGISLRGLHLVFASPWWRTRPAVRGHPARAQLVLGAPLAVRPSS